MIAFQELIGVPRFLRFGNVLLVYLTGSQPIAEKCESFGRYLPSIKTTLHDSEMISFYCQINEEEDGEENPTGSFSDHPTLIEHIRHILSICDSSRGYAFDFVYYKQTDSDTGGNLIASILEMPAIACSSTVSIFYNNSTITQLPVETISNWLNREHHALEQNKRARTLQFICNVQDDQIQEICVFLKQVFFLFRIFSILLFAI